jgi:hypothetical protein
MLQVNTYEELEAIENMEQFVSSNMGRLLDLWSGLVRGMVALSRNANGDADAGIEAIKTIQEELGRMSNDELPQRDYIAAYFASTISTEKNGVEDLMQELYHAQTTLEQTKSGKASVGERERTEAFLDSLIEQLKSLFREHEVKLLSAMYGIRKNGSS